MLTVWVVIFKKPNLRICLLLEVSFLYYNYCPIRLIFAILFCVFSLSCLFSSFFFFLVFTFQWQVFQPNVLYSIPTSSSWKFLTGIFSAIFSYLFPFLHSSETPNASTYSLQILYIILESSLSWFSQGWYRFGGLSFIVLVLLICLKFFSGLIFNSPRIITCFESRKLWWTEGVGEGK